MFLAREGQDGRRKSLSDKLDLHAAGTQSIENPLERRSERRDLLDGVRTLLRPRLIVPRPCDESPSELGRKECGPAPPQPEESDRRTELVVPGHGRRWIEDLWRAIIESALTGRKAVPRFPWSDLPALGRFSITQPSLYRLAQDWNTATRRGSKRVFKPFANQVKPTNFLLVAYLDTGTLGREAYSTQTGNEGSRPIRPVAPYDPENRTRLPWRDYHTGMPVRLTWAKTPSYLASELRVQTYHDMISRYLVHPEARAAGGDGAGALVPLHVVITDIGQIRHIGKEAHRIEEVQVLGLGPDTYLHYVDKKAVLERTRAIIARIPRRLAAKYAALSKRQITRFVGGESIPQRRNLTQLIAIAGAWEMANDSPAAAEAGWIGSRGAGSSLPADEQG